jgi:hypothetical protein
MVVVHTFKTEAEGEALEALLRGSGIHVGIIRQSDDSAFDGLMLSEGATDRILVPEEDLGRAKGLIEEYLQSIPTADDAETMHWKRELASKRLRMNRAGTWILPVCMVAFGLWAIIKGTEAWGQLVGLVVIVLAIVVFRGMRERCRQDQKIISEMNCKPD